MRITTKTALSSFLLIIAACVFGHAQTHRVGSVYTSLKEKDCTKTKRGAGEGVVYSGICKGVGGYRINVLASEHSSAIDLIGPNGKSLDIDIHSAIGSAAPSSLGEKAEWRIRRRGKSAEPFALIVRVNLFTEPGNYNKTESYLAVVKISADSGCVVGIVSPSAKQNVEARAIADDSPPGSCM